MARSISKSLAQKQKDSTAFAQRLSPFVGMTGMLYICGESPHGAQLPTNPIATCKFQGVTLGREEAIANSWPDEQKPNTKAYQVDKLAKDSEVPKGNRNLDA